MKELNGPETYKAIAQALPWGIRSALISLRDFQDDSATLEEFWNLLPTTIYIAIQELCLATPWDETSRSGLQLTSAGKHLAEFCTC